MKDAYERNMKKFIPDFDKKLHVRVAVNLIKTVYKTGRKVGESFKNNMPIIFDSILPKWNYRAVTQNA